MSDFVIMTDCTCDLTKEIRDRFGLEYVKGHITLPDGTEKETTLEWDVFSEKEFYGALKRGDNFSTTPPNVERFTEEFRKYASQGKDVLSIAISTGLSGTYSFMMLAKKAVQEEFPERKIICIDSLRYSSLIGLLMVYASMLRSEGKSIEETAAWIEENKNRFRESGWIDDMFYIARKGRVSNSKAFLGRLVGIKCIGEIDEKGMTTIIGKTRGKKAAYSAVLGYMEAVGENLQDQIIFIGHSDRRKESEVFREKIIERFHPKEVIITDIYPACGVNIGPGLMSAYFVGKPISPGLEEEKKLMAGLTGK